MKITLGIYPCSIKIIIKRIDIEKIIRNITVNVITDAQEVTYLENNDNQFDRFEKETNHDDG